jgi:hypothetical protein
VSGPAQPCGPGRTEKRKRADYTRWERSRSMELWQMDIVGGVKLKGGGEAKIVPGIMTTADLLTSRMWSNVRPLDQHATR